MGPCRLALVISGSSRKHPGVAHTANVYRPSFFITLGRNYWPAISSVEQGYQNSPMPEEVPQKWAGLHGMMIELHKLGEYAHMRVLDARILAHLSLVIGLRTD